MKPRKNSQKFGSFDALWGVPRAAEQGPKTRANDWVVRHTLGSAKSSQTRPKSKCEAGLVARINQKFGSLGVHWEAPRAAERGPKHVRTIGSFDTLGSAKSSQTRPKSKCEVGLVARINQKFGSLGGLGSAKSGRARPKTRANIGSFDTLGSAKSSQTRPKSKCEVGFGCPNKPKSLGRSARTGSAKSGRARPKNARTLGRSINSGERREQSNEAQKHAHKRLDRSTHSGERRERSNEAQKLVARINPKVWVARRALGSAKSGRAREVI
jgi:hypothetical protein